MTLAGLGRAAESSEKAELTTKPSVASYPLFLVATGRRRWAMTAVLLMCFYTAVSFLYSKNDRGYLFYGSALPRNENDSVTPTGTESAIHRIAPLVVQYRRDGTWNPPLQSIGWGNLSATVRSVIDTKKGKEKISTKSFLGCIRIKKTASTSFASFIKHASLRTFDHYLLNDTKFTEQLPKDQAGKPNSGFAHCIFGESSPTLHQQQQQKEEEQEPNSCIHTDYENLVSLWAQSLNFLPDVADNPTNNGSSFLVTLHPITIVRDPLDRFISYFRFARKMYPKWSSSLPPEAITMLKEGNLEGFLYLLPQSRKYEHVRNKNHYPNVAFQYEYLSRQNVDEAISMVRGGTGHDVLPLVNECFDASLYLLTDLYPQFFPGKSITKAFLQSPAASSNVRQNRNPETPEELAMRGLSPEQPLSSSNQNLTILRQKAKESFLADDYRFYEAAVSQFLRYLVASNVDRPIVDECLQKLSLVLLP